jgi:hypothetical protein
VLNKVAEGQRFVVGDIALVKVGLDGACDRLQIELGRHALNTLEVPTRTSRHARCDHTFSFTCRLLKESVAIQQYTHYESVSIHLA